MVYNSTHELATQNNIINMTNEYENIICLNKFLKVTKMAHVRFTNATHRLG